MKKFILLLILLPLSAIAKDVVQDNYLCANGAINSITMLSLYNYSVTSGQPVKDPILVDSSHKPGCIDFRAGRKKSEDPLLFAYSYSYLNNINILGDGPWGAPGGDNVVTLTGGYTHVPDKLNFAFTGKIKLTGDHTDSYFICDYVVIGQTNSGNDNYWMLVDNSDQTETHQLLCTEYAKDTDKKLCQATLDVHPVSKTNYAFSFTESSCQ